MRMLLALLFMAHTACAMEGSPGPLDKLSQAGSSFLNFFKEIPQTVKEVLPVFKSSSEEEESSSGSEQDVLQVTCKPIVKEVRRVASPPLQESPPKERLLQDAVMGERIPEMPMLFMITNRTSFSVCLVAVLTAPYKPKKYVIPPNQTMRIGTLSNACFQQVYVEQSHENNVHPEPYCFNTALLIKLCIEKKLISKEPQLSIRERSDCLSCIHDQYYGKK